MYKVVILTLAKMDVKKSAVWYDTKQKGLGYRFLSEVRRKIKLVAQHPYAYSIRYDEVRTAILDVFPFMVHYDINDTQKLITVLAVLHTSRDPDLWRTDGEDEED